MSFPWAKQYEPKLPLTRWLDERLPVPRLVYNAVAARDYPVIQGAVLLIAALFLAINLIVDVLYAVVDPRIRLA